MRAKTVAILALVVAALGAFIWFVERDLPSSEERTERSRRLFPVESDAVSSLTLEWQGREVRLERTAAALGEGDDEESAALPVVAEWRFAAPEALAGAAADRIEVGRLLSVLLGLAKQRELEAADEAAVGLDAPRGRVIVASDDATYTVEVGADVPAAETVVVARTEGGERHLFVTGRAFLADLERAPGDWRSKEIVSASRDAVERLELAPADGPAVVIERRQGRFHLSSPFADLAATEEVERLLSDLVSLRAQRFVDDVAAAGGPEALGLAPPRATLTAALAGGGAGGVRIELGGPVAGGAGAIYARSGEQVFEAVTELAGHAARPADEWRSRAWTELRSFEVERVEVRRGGEEPLRLVRDGADWLLGGAAAPVAAVSDLLFAVTDARGEAIGAAADEPPAGEPLLIVILGSEASGEEVLTLYPDVGGLHPARSSARAAAVMLPATAAAEIDEAVAALGAGPVGSGPAQ